jgi:hypothetical protein
MASNYIGAKLVRSVRNPDVGNVAFELYRREGFPVFSLNRDEKKKELEKLFRYNHKLIINGEGEIKQAMHGLPLAWNYHPHAWAVRCAEMRTPMETFLNDAAFRKVIDKRIRYAGKVSDNGIRKQLRIHTGTQAASNFRPTAAAAIYHKYLPEAGGVTWDMSSGWSGRLLGAIACSRVLKYIGTDPSTETMDGLLEMADELLPMARSMGRNLEVELHMLGSETKEIRDALPESGVHAAFGSPPYFGQEEYSPEPSQSWKRYPDQESWLNGFMGATLDNCAYCLKPGGILAINIADVSSYKGSLEVDFIALAKSKGWKLVETLKLHLSSMMGSIKYKSCQKCQMLTGKEHGTKPVDPAFTGKWKKCDEHKYKTEPVFVFKRKQ